MSVILLMLGVLLSAAGGALIGFGIPIKELSLGSTMILAGAFAVVGGLLLIGLSAVVTELARVTAALKAAPPQTQLPATRAARAEVQAPPTESVAREPVKEVVTEPEPPLVLVPPIPAPAPVVAAATPASAEVSAIERLRSTIPRTEKAMPETVEAVPLSPNGQHAVHHVESPTQVEAVPRSAGAAAVEAREPRLDFLFRPRQQQRPAPQQEAFESLWPKRSGREGPGDPRLEVARAVTTTPHPTPTVVAPPAAPAPAPQERTVAILKSGVVDGMAYTLYADGSIEAQLPQGTVRFGSIAELRAHIENNA
jgi:hypothetical protein